jgi:hypothetical protein
VKPVCNELRRILGGQGLKELAQIEVQLVQNKVIGTPVDPMTATPASAAPKGASTKPPATTKNQCVAMSDAQLVKVQQALVKSGQLKDEAFTPDNNVPKALLDYQTAQNVKDSGCKPGQIGSATLSKLIPKPAGQQ